MTKEEFNIDDIDLSFYMNFSDQIRHRIVYKLINREKNADFLKGVPYVEYLDLAIVFYYLLPEKKENEFESILIQKHHMDMWGIEVSDLMDAASMNTPRLLGLKIQGILSTIAEYLGNDELLCMAEEEDSYVPMYVATNKLSSNGASVFIYKDLLEAVAAKLKSDIYIIPSSVHEVIFIRAMKNCQIDIDEVKNMIKEVNTSEVPEKDVLSDSLYFYSRKENTICML